MELTKNYELMFWYDADVKGVEAKKSEVVDPKTIFYGSSSIRLWTSLYKDFEAYKPVNLAFGGSTLAACIVFFERIMKDLNPDIFILYAGDNDLGDGRHPEEVFIFFKQMVVEVRKRFGNIPLVYVSIKPSIKRFNIVNQIKYTNKLIKEEIEKTGNNVYFVDIFDAMLDSNKNPNNTYFLEEGLHINEKGYAIWKDIITNYLINHHITIQ